MKRTDGVKDLSTLRERVEQWREGRTKRTRIPEELWTAAVRVARVEGVYATSRATRFDYYSLKNRMALAGMAAGETTEAAAFIEFRGAGGAGTTVVEIVGRHGGRMRIDVSGASGVDVVGLAQAFWRHQA